MLKVERSKISCVVESSGVARGVAGVAEATPIFEVLFNIFGQKIWVKKENHIHCRLHQSQNPTNLPDRKCIHSIDLEISLYLITISYFLKVI